MTLATFKKIVKWIVGMCAGFTVADVIANNTHPEKARHKAEVFVGGAVIGGIVAEAAEDYTDRAIDEIADAWKNAKAEFKNS